MNLGEFKRAVNTHPYPRIRFTCQRDVRFPGQQEDNTWRACSGTHEYILASQKWLKCQTITEFQPTSNERFLIRWLSATHSSLSTVALARNHVFSAICTRTLEYPPIPLPSPPKTCVKVIVKVLADQLP